MKRRIPVILFLCLLVLDVSAFLIDKLASERAAISSGGSNVGTFYLNVLTQPWIWMLAVVGPLQLLIWTRVLKRVDLSIAYPISSISYPATMFAAELFFGERLTPLVWIGALLMTIGIATLGSTHHEASNPPSVEPIAVP